LICHRCRRAAPSLVAVLALCLAAPPAGAQQEAQFVAIDVNKDGAIDRAEFQAARLADFRTIDANRDGSLSRIEFVERDAGGQFTLRALRARRFEEMDRNGDGRVSRAEYVAFGTVVFARVDLNGDGRVTREEFLNPRRAPPTKPGDDTAAPLPPGEGGAGRDSGSDPRRPGFTALDLDADGVITARELDESRARAFRELDADGDGRLTAAEAITQMGQAAARRFAQLDVDKDGFVTLQEYIAAGRVLLTRSDVNKDGRITWEEFKATTPLP
jgi:Ca2+-binding EF-hand superfamily protein